VFTWLPRYDRRWLRGDLIAGLTVWAVLVPEALAYASIAGVSPVVGLCAAPGALIFYAAFGSSRHLVTGPMAATAALSAAAVGDLAAQGSDAFLQLTITLALVVGGLAVLAGLARLGFLASFISEPVLKGFIIGLALTIIVGQLPKLFGVEKGEGDFFEQLWDLLTNLGGTSGLTLLVGILSLALVVALKEFVPVVPGSLIAVLGGIAAVQLFDLDEHGVAIVGEIQSGLPSLGLPDVAAHRYLDVAPAAVGVMLVGFVESLGAAKTYATRNHYEIDANRELLGLGAANLAAGFSSGMIVNGSLSKTAVNGSAGANSQVSGLVVAALTVITLLFFTGLFEKLPEALLAAVVIAALVELVDVLTISLLLLLYRASRPNVAVLGRVPGTPDQYGDIARDAENTLVPGLVVLRPESGLFFANADAVRDRIRRQARTPGTRAIVLDAESMPFIDVTAANMLTELASDLERAGIRLVLARNIGEVRDLLRVAATDERTLPAYRTVQDAVAALGGSPDRDR
jgi:sulfate permease, SulP family